jgi:8-oxo-dGTP pyrophosphatase MutT (NUDIX family)
MNGPENIEREAGAVVLRRDGQQRVLVITSKTNPAHWLFPKGHIEPGESAQSAAAREALEEAGVHVKPVAPIGTTRYSHNGRDFEVEYFLCDYGGQEHAREGRRYEWLPPDEAGARLSFRELRQILDRAIALSSEMHRSRP